MLRRLVQSTIERQTEQCDLCGEVIPPRHRHLLDVSARNVLCVCRPCSILFQQEAASEGKLRLIPDRRLNLADFRMNDAQWESLQVPVGIAFFTYSTPAGHQAAYYPSPAGPTESLLPLNTWTELVVDNPILAAMAADVEALLVNRARGARQYFLVPVDECYRLVGLIRLRWRGLSGGQEVWATIGQFFEELGQRSTSVVPTS